MATKDKDGNVYYRTSTGRYKPFGVMCSSDYLSDGLWYVKHREHCRSITKIEYLANLFHIDVPNKPIELNTLCAMEDAVNYIFDSKEYNDLMKKKGYSMQELMHVVVKLIFEKYTKK